MVRQGGALAVLALAVLGVYRGWWVPGWLYRAEQARCERLERLAWSLTTAAEKAVDGLRQPAQLPPGRTEPPHEHPARGAP